MRCLILNQDNQLLHITKDWMESICLNMEGKVRVLSYYDKVVRSQYLEFPIPAVAMLNYYVIAKKRKRVFTKPTKKNILIRDKFACQYCGTRLSYGTGTVDHVIAKDNGGQDTITNCVASCKRCNNAKDNLWLSDFTKKTGMTLKNQPRLLTEEEKLECVLHSFKSKEKKVWLKTLKENNIELW